MGMVIKFHLCTGYKHAPLYTCVGSFLQETPAQSQDNNSECLPGTFFDYHDLWHMLSAIALYSTASVGSLHTSTASTSTFALYYAHYLTAYFCFIYALDKGLGQNTVYLAYMHTYVKLTADNQSGKE